MDAYYGQTVPDSEVVTKKGNQCGAPQAHPTNSSTTVYIDVLM
jgi:hypothetical protein